MTTEIPAAETGELIVICEIVTRSVRQPQLRAFFWRGHLRSGSAKPFKPMSGEKNLRRSIPPYSARNADGECVILWNYQTAEAGKTSTPA
jgi:hypothetical protein